MFQPDTLNNFETSGLVRDCIPFIACIVGSGRLQGLGSSIKFTKTSSLFISESIDLYVEKQETSKSSLCRFCIRNPSLVKYWVKFNIYVHFPVPVQSESQIMFFIFWQKGATSGGGSVELWIIIRSLSTLTKSRVVSKYIYACNSEPQNLGEFGNLAKACSPSSKLHGTLSFPVIFNIIYSWEREDAEVRTLITECEGSSIKCSSTSCTVPIYPLFLERLACWSISSTHWVVLVYRVRWGNQFCSLAKCWSFFVSCLCGQLKTYESRGGPQGLWECSSTHKDT